MSSKKKKCDSCEKPSSQLSLVQESTQRRLAGKDNCKCEDQWWQCPRKGFPNHIEQLVCGTTEQTNQHVNENCY